VLIDSTGLPNDIDFPLTAMNVHEGSVNNEARLILVLDKKSRLPIYFRYTSGNIVDVSTLEATVAEVKAHGIDIEQAIVDAGYCSETNINALRSANASFVMRMPANRKMYKELVSEHAGRLADARNLVKYRDRFVYIKRVEIDLYGAPCFAYVAEDMDRKHDEIKNYFIDNYYNVDLTFDDMNKAMHTKGMFVLIASKSIDKSAIMPLYYTRQAIEQVFDINKNNIDLLPLRVHGIETFRGLMLVSFITSVAYVLVNEYLCDTDFRSIEAYRLFKNLKCKVFDDQIIIQELNKKMNDIAKAVKLSFPKVLPL
jgi:transposase